MERILFQLVQFKNAMIQQYMKKKVRLKGKRKLVLLSTSTMRRRVRATWWTNLVFVKIFIENILERPREYQIY